MSNLVYIGKSFGDIPEKKKRGQRNTTEGVQSCYLVQSTDFLETLVCKVLVKIPRKKQTVSYLNSITKIVWFIFQWQLVHLHNRGPYAKVSHCFIQVHPYTFRNENQYLHFDFHQDPYTEFDFWINKMGIDGLFTDFTGSLHNFQQWTSPLSPGMIKNHD